VFDPVSVFRVLYRNVIYRVCNDRVIGFEESSDLILRSGFIKLIENHLLEYFRQSIHGTGKSTVEIYCANLERFKDQ
jgi:hypothetical protein